MVMVGNSPLGNEQTFYNDLKQSFPIGYGPTLQTDIAKGSRKC